MRINGTALLVAAVVVTIGAIAFPVWSYADRYDRPDPVDSVGVLR